MRSCSNRALRKCELRISIITGVGRIDYVRVNWYILLISQFDKNEGFRNGSCWKLFRETVLHICVRLSTTITYVSFYRKCSSIMSLETRGLFSFQNGCICVTPNGRFLFSLLFLIIKLVLPCSPSRRNENLYKDPTEFDKDVYSIREPRQIRLVPRLKS